MLYMHGIGHFFPENVITNRFLEELDIGTNDSWILERVGIRSRRTVLPLDYIRQTHNQKPQEALDAALYTTAELAQPAAQMAMKRAGIEPDQIGMVISGSCVFDNAIPAQACQIANVLGINVPSFDLNSACSSFGAHLHFLNMMKEEALPEFILIVQPEEFTRFIDYADRRSAVLFGDGAAAAVISTRVKSRIKIHNTAFHSSPSGWDKVIIPWYKHFNQDGTAVQMFAIKRTRDLVKEILEKSDIHREELKFIGHQANLLVLEGVCDACGISSDHHYFNVDEYGNSGAAGAPTVLSMNWENFRDGDQLAVAVVGSGLSWSSALIQFGDEK